MISPTSRNPMLTDLGRANVFRVQPPRRCGRHRSLANYLADHWSDKKIAILHDNTAFGKGIAEVAKKQLNRRGVTEAIYRGLRPRKGRLWGRDRCSFRRRISPWRSLADTTPRSRSWHVAARDRGYPVQLVAGNDLASRGVWPHCRPRGRRNALH